MPSQPRPPRTGIFHRESTRLRSNVADQVQRDLLPAGRMLSVFRVLCELLAEIAVLVSSRHQLCDRPLRLWVFVLMILQAGTIVLNCLNIWHGRDSFGQHRNGLSASDLDMYTDSPTSSVPSVPARLQQHPTHHNHRDHPDAPADSLTDVHDHSQNTAPTSIVVDVIHSAQDHSRTDLDANLHFQPSDTQPLIQTHIDSNTSSSFSTTLSTFERTPSAAAQNSRDTHDRSNESSNPLDHHARSRSRQQSPRHAAHSPALLNPRAPSNPPPSLARDSFPPSQPSLSNLVSTEFLDRYVRIVNAWSLIWFIIGSVWVSDGGNCYSTAPHLYRLVVALAIIYYALLFLPLACFCLIVCCLPLFILVYRIMLPYAERERRRARAADPAQVQNLSSIVYSPATFASHTSSESVEDASCVICLCEYEPDEIVRFLPCKHHFHKDCVDVWLRLDKACCLCKQDIDAQAQPISSPV